VEPGTLTGRRAVASAGPDDRILVATPVKDCANFLGGYAALLERLTYPHALISIALLESDSMDETYLAAQQVVAGLRSTFGAVQLFKCDYGYRIPSTIRWIPSLQPRRRSILAASRNQLLARSLRDHAWVLWLDADVIDYPPDLIEQLLATGKQIVNAHCVRSYGGVTYDLNAWRDRGRLHLGDLRGEGPVVRLHAVGGTVLLVRGDLHRDGLHFPEEPYGDGNPLARDGGELETEGLGIMAHDMGASCWGMPGLEVLHFDALAS
jgi:Anp1